MVTQEPGQLVLLVFSAPAQMIWACDHPAGCYTQHGKRDNPSQVNSWQWLHDTTSQEDNANALLESNHWAHIDIEHPGDRCCQLYR